MSALPRTSQPQVARVSPCRGLPSRFAERLLIRAAFRCHAGGGAPMRVLICGGGVIGASIAYFLSRRGVAAIVIERTGLACAASGKSGGFLALDWCDGTPLEALARRSFALHASLAERDRRRLGLSPPDHLRRLLRLARRCRSPRQRRPRLALGERGRRPPPRLDGDDGAGPPGAVHRGADAGGGGAGRGAPHRARSPASFAGTARAASPASRSTARSSRATRSSSPWVRGRSLRRAGCRCRASTG